MQSRLSSQGGNITAETELRHLPLTAHNRLISFLDSTNDVWKTFASIIPNLDKGGEPLLSYENIRSLEQQWNCPGSSPGSAVLKDWCHRGRKRPTVAHLLDVFIEMKFYRAADFVSQELLNGDPICRSLSNVTISDSTSISCDINNENISLDECSNVNSDTIQSYDISLALTSEEDETEMDSNNPMSELNQANSTVTENSKCHTASQLEVSNENNHQSAEASKNRSPAHQSAIPFKVPNQNNSPKCHSPVITPVAKNSFSRCSIPHFRYQDLYNVTKKFSSVSFNRGGSKLGEGAFGEVYLGVFQNGLAAIKRLKRNTQQFDVELEVLAKYKHKNLLPLIGYSGDGPAPCLIYKYIENGSLQEHIDWKHQHPKKKSISWQTRISIALGTAKGIIHLHTFREPPLVHRDIKSANILLDNQMMPKVADFGLARIGDSGLSTTMTVTHNISGTSVYMAPEAHRGDVSVKLDTFSYGVVLLELLTGLYPFDPSREDRDLISHMENNCKDIIGMLDKSAGNWDEDKARSLYKITLSCIEEKKKNRPTVQQIFPDLEALLS